ncbi:MAG: hypothetical protein C4334_15285, partial [Pyrinomonas sp.]
GGQCRCGAWVKGTTKRGIKGFKDRAVKVEVEQVRSNSWKNRQHEVKFKKMFEKIIPIQG